MFSHLELSSGASLAAKDRPYLVCAKNHPVMSSQQAADALKHDAETT